MLIAGFLGGLVSNFVAFYIAYELAPSHQRLVLIVFISLGVIAGLVPAYLILVEHDYHGSLPIVAGNLLACYIGWRVFVSSNKDL